MDQDPEGQKTYGYGFCEFCREKHDFSLEDFKQHMNNNFANGKIVTQFYKGGNEMEKRSC
jgi:hypothetical protein